MQFLVFTTVPPFPCSSRITFANGSQTRRFLSFQRQLDNALPNADTSSSSIWTKPWSTPAGKISPHTATTSKLRYFSFEIVLRRRHVCRTAALRKRVPSRSGRNIHCLDIHSGEEKLRGLSARHHRRRQSHPEKILQGILQESRWEVGEGPEIPEKNE